MPPGLAPACSIAQVVVVSNYTKTLDVIVKMLQYVAMHHERLSCFWSSRLEPTSAMVV